MTHKSKAGVGWPAPGVPEAWRIGNIGAACAFDWQINFKSAESLERVGVEYLPMQWSARGWDSVNARQIRLFAKRFKGRRWLAFNEPDVTTQANAEPWEAARAFYRFQDILRDADPSAKIYVGGTGFWPNHTRWLGLFAQRYHDQRGCYPDIDGIHFHSYMNPDPDGDGRITASSWAARFDTAALKAQALGTKAWLQLQPWSRGKPVIISEYAVLSGAWHNDRDKIANEFLPSMFRFWASQAWVENHMWFSTHYERYSPSDLFYRDGTKTQVGHAFAREVLRTEKGK